jgi:hypothetical protein
MRGPRELLSVLAIANLPSLIFAENVGGGKGKPGFGVDFVSNRRRNHWVEIAIESVEELVNFGFQFAHGVVCVVVSLLTTHLATWPKDCNNNLHEKFMNTVTR